MTYAELEQHVEELRQAENLEQAINEVNQFMLGDHSLDEISKAELVSPISGVIVQGDLKRKIGAPVKTGEILFEVCPLESLRAELHVPEDQIFDIQVGQEGTLVTVSYPNQRIPFIIERINPIAEVVGQRNVFKVRVQLLQRYQWMRPGMEGVAKVTIEKRRYIWIWTRKVVDWVRMKLWL